MLWYTVPPDWRTPSQVCWHRYLRAEEGPHDRAGWNQWVRADRAQLSPSRVSEWGRRRGRGGQRPDLAPDLGAPLALRLDPGPHAGPGRRRGERPLGRRP